MTIAYSKSDADLIETFSHLPKSQKSSGYWSSDEVNSIRSKAKAHFIEIQRRKCCYCRSDLGTSRARVWDLEHFAPRSRYPHFMFEERNLSVSCIECNSSKDDFDTIERGSSLRKYPTDEKRFKLVHPHYDRYGDHITWYESTVPWPKTNKGKITVYRCDLMRFALDTFQAAGNLQDRRFETEVDVVMSTKPTVIERAAAQAVISKVLDNLSSKAVDVARNENNSDDGKRE